MRSIKFLVFTPVFSRFILILSSHVSLGFPKDLFLTCLPVKIAFFYYNADLYISSPLLLIERQRPEQTVAEDALMWVKDV